jgi:hypothetical protein
MVTNFFVMSRVRMAYEAGAPPYISPERWIEAGSPPGMGMVFGVSELRVEELSPPGAAPAEGSPVERRFRASYRFWLPESAASPEEGPEGASLEDPFTAGPPEPPRSLAYGHVDELVLRLVKDSWRIAELRREAGGWE